MKSLKLLLCASLALAMASCGKKAPPAGEAPAAADSAASAPAASAAADAGSAASGAAAPAAAAPDADPAVAEKQRKIDFALSEQKIADDPAGQWATTATASSTYQDAQGKAAYSADHATGKPDVIARGDDGNAWAPKEADAGIEWLQLGFAKPVNATGIRIRQNIGPGAIIKVELIDDKDGRHTVFEGADVDKYDDYNWWFTRKFDKTPYLVKGAKITLATNAVPSWNEVDAVQLLSE